jgi:hypothetical protein
MAVINIKTIAKILEKSARARSMFRWAVKATLFLLEQQRLIDHRQIERVTLDWEKKTLNLGDDFTSKVMARAFGEYVVDRKFKKPWDFKEQGKARSEAQTNFPKNNQ